MSAVAEQVRPQTAVAQVCHTIKRPEFREQLKEALPPGVDPERFTRVVLTAIQQNPKIAEVQDRQSLFNAATRAASDGLLPDGREGAFVEFRKKDANDKWISAVQFMPMVAGIIKRLATAGITIDAQLVHEHDEFDQTFGDHASITHKAPKLGQPRGEILGAYAIAHLANGMVMREVMDKQQIDQVRSASKSKDGGPWSQWFGEMARKTVIRRLAKRLPILDAKVADTISSDDDLYDFAAGNASPTDTGITNATGQDKKARRPKAFDTVAAAAGNTIDQQTGEVLNGSNTGGPNTPAPESTSPSPSSTPSGHNEPGAIDEF